MAKVSDQSAAKIAYCIVVLLTMIAALCDVMDEEGD